MTSDDFCFKRPFTKPGKDNILTTDLNLSLISPLLDIESFYAPTFIFVLKLKTVWILLHGC